MHFSIVHRARGSLAFQLVLDDGGVAVTGTPQADVEACMQVLREVVMVLREGGGAVHGAKAGHRVTLTGELGTALAESVAFASAAEADALLARIRGELTADPHIRVTFPPEQRAMNQSQTDLSVAIRYDLEERSKSQRSGLEPIRRSRDNLYSAHFNDENGAAVLYIRGFSGRHPRDEQARALVQAMADARRYRRQDGEGRVHFVVTARNGRELARSRWFATWDECEAMIAWLVRVAPASLAALDPPPAPAKSVAGYLLTRPSNGTVGFETFRGDDRRHYFHLNDGGGAALLFSHGYSSPRERDAGMRALIRVATVRDAYQVRRDGAHFHFAVLAGNSRELARSRDFASPETTQAAIRWTVGAIARLGADAGVRRPPTMLLEVSAEDATGKGTASPGVRATEASAGSDGPAAASGASVEPAASVVPEAASVEPEAASVVPEAASVVPEAASVEPEAASVEPEAAGVASPEPVASTVTNLASEASLPAPVREAAGAATRSRKIPGRVEALLAELRSNQTPELGEATAASPEDAKVAVPVVAEAANDPAVSTGSGDADNTADAPDVAAGSPEPVSGPASDEPAAATPTDVATPAPDASVQSDARPLEPTSSRSRRSDPQEFPASYAMMLMAHDDSRPYRVKPRVPPPEEASPAPVAADEPQQITPSGESATATTGESPTSLKSASDAAAVERVEPVVAAQAPAEAASEALQVSRSQATSTVPENSELATVPATSAVPPAAANSETMAAVPVVEPVPAAVSDEPLVARAPERAAASDEPLVARAPEPTTASREPSTDAPVNAAVKSQPDAPAPVSAAAKSQATSATSGPMTSQVDAPATIGVAAKSQATSLAASTPAKPQPDASAPVGAAPPSLAASKPPAPSLGPVTAKPRLTPPPPVSSGAPAKPQPASVASEPKSPPSGPASVLPKLPANLLAVASQPSKLKPPRIASAPTPGEPGVQPMQLPVRPPSVPIAGVKPPDVAPTPAPAPAVIMHVAPDPGPPTLPASAPSLVPSLVPEFASKVRESQSSTPAVIMRGAVDGAPLVAPSLVPSVLPPPDPAVKQRTNSPTAPFAVIHDGVPKQRSSMPSSSQPAAKKRRTIDSMPAADMFARLVDDLAADPYPPGSPEGEDEPPPPPRPVIPPPIPSLIPEVMHTPPPLPPATPPAAPASARAASPQFTGLAAGLPTPMPQRDRGGGGRVLFFIGLVALAVVAVVLGPCASRSSQAPDDPQRAPSRTSMDARPSPDDPPAPAAPSASQVALVCPAEAAADPAIGVLVAPFQPASGEPLRVLAATLADEAPLDLQIFGRSENRVELVATARAGVPSTALTSVTLPAGEYTAVVGRGGQGLRCEKFTVNRTRRSEKSTTKVGTWPVERAWTAGEEALYSAWLRQLFDAPDEAELSFAHLDRATGDPGRNLLHDALRWGEDSEPGLRLRPDADLPYALRAYWAWKRRLPFAFRGCSRGTAHPPRCTTPRSNLTPVTEPEASGIATMQRFFQRTLAYGVHTGNARTAAGDEDSDFYPVALTRRSLRPGTIYADPYGHILVIVDQRPATATHDGALLAVDGQPGGTITRKHFGRATFLWSSDAALGGTGFKRFRPAVKRGDEVTQLGDAALTDAADHDDLWQGHADLTAEQFYDQVDALVSPGRRDPFRVQRGLVDDLARAARARVEAVERGAAQTKPGAVIAMPKGYEVFETVGAWETYASPGRDLRLLIALDVVEQFAGRAAANPEVFKPASGGSIADGLALERARLLADPRHEFSYRRSDGTPWKLSLAALATRTRALEVAYNPNDCPEVRWGAPAGSEEASTCARRAPRDQQARMNKYRPWFRDRTPPPRGTPG